MRIEGTIKNKKHFQSLYRTDKECTLLHLLSITEATHNLALKTMAAKHLNINSPQTIEREASAWGLSDAFCAAFLRHQKTEQLAKNAIALDTSGKKQTYKARQKIAAIWNDLFKDMEKGENAAGLDVLFGALGIGE